MTPKPKVLIVEDEAWLGEEFVRTLHKAGFDTVVEKSVFGAIEKIDEFKPNAILLDILLAGNTAFTLLNEMQSYQDTAAIPIVVCTNLGADLDKKDLAEYGVKVVLDKATMAPEDVAVAIRSVI